MKNFSLYEPAVMKGVLRRIQDSEVIFAITTAARDQHSQLGVLVRAALSIRPAKADLRYLINSFAHWPVDDREHAIANSKGSLKSALIALNKGPLSYYQWLELGETIPPAQLRVLMIESEIGDDELARIALANRNNGCHSWVASHLADKILREDPTLSVTRFLYCASRTTSPTLANIARTQFDPEVLARQITPANVAAAWVLAITPAASDDRLRRWLHWLSQMEDDYNPLKSRRSWIFRRTSEVDEPIALTAYTLSVTAAARGVTARELPSILAYFEGGFDNQNVEDHVGFAYNWRNRMMLRSLVYSTTEDLESFAPSLLWEREILERNYKSSESILTIWAQRDWNADKILDCAWYLLKQGSDREAAIALILALVSANRQSITQGSIWLAIRSLVETSSGVGIALREIAASNDECSKLNVEVDLLNKRLKYLNFGTRDDRLPTISVALRDNSALKLSTVDDLCLALGILRNVSRSGAYGKPTLNLSEQYLLAINLSIVEREAFLVLLDDWQGSISECVDAAKVLCRVEDDL
jgi:hypothetical protein